MYRITCLDLPKARAACAAEKLPPSSAASFRRAGMAPSDGAGQAVIGFFGGELLPKSFVRQSREVRRFGGDGKHA